MAVHGYGDYGISVKWKDGNKDKHYFQTEKERDIYFKHLKGNPKISKIEKI